MINSVVISGNGTFAWDLCFATSYPLPQFFFLIYVRPFVQLFPSRRYTSLQLVLTTGDLLGSVLDKLSQNVCLALEFIQLGGSQTSPT